MVRRKSSILHICIEFFAPSKMDKSKVHWIVVVQCSHTQREAKIHKVRIGSLFLRFDLHDKRTEFHIPPILHRAALSERALGGRSPVAGIECRELESFVHKALDP
jgi:hypothetical protein